MRNSISKKTSVQPVPPGFRRPLRVWLRFRRAVTTQYADFNGRASRSDYWAFAIVSSALIFLAGLIGELAAKVFGQSECVGLIPAALISLVLLIPSVSILCRRFHDINLSGWWIASFVLVLPALFFMGLILFAPAHNRNNRYGNRWSKKR